MDLNPIANYIQYLAINPDQQPNDEVYKRDFGGVGVWFKDAVALCNAVGVQPRDIYRELDGRGVVGPNKVGSTAGMRRQYVVDCWRAKKAIDLNSPIEV